VAIDRNGTVYAGGSMGVYASSDGGRSWRGGKPFPTRDSVGHRLIEGQVYGIAVGATHTIYAASFNSVFGSSDGARTWHRVHAFGSSTFVNAVLADPRRSNVLYALSFRPGGVYTSTDAGRTWMLSHLAGRSVDHFAIAPDDPLTMVAGTQHGVLLSRDGGATWTQVAAITSSYATAVATARDGVIDVATDDGLFTSNDFGATWTRASASHPYVLARSGATIYAGGEAGVENSADGGASWRRASTGIAGLRIAALAVHGRSVVGADFGGGTIVSVDAGVHWRDSRTVGRPIAVAVTPRLVYVGTWSDGLQVSGDRGATWQRLANGLPAQRVTGLAVDTANADVVLAATSLGVFRTTNGGDTWRATSIRTQARVVAAYDGAIYAGTNGGGIWKSSDSGVTWTRRAPVYSGQVYSIARSSDGTLYVSTLGAIFRSDDDGASWRQLKRPARSAPAYALVCVGNTVYAGSDQAYAARSTDGGTTWQQWNEGLRSGVLSLATDGRTIYAGTAGSGIVRRTP
jgi:photosystem II stability/assembly factor-like uncharacterized protein